MEGLFTTLRQEFTLRLREEVREHVSQAVNTIATLIVVGAVLAISLCAGILLR